MKEVSAPCSSCLRQTTHKVRHERALTDEDPTTTYAMLECSGCHHVCLGEQVRFIPDGEVEHTNYRSPVSRKEPDWLLFMIVHGGQYRLAAMAIRALPEQIMVSKVGDLGSFEKQLDAFEKAGYISPFSAVQLRPHSNTDAGCGRPKLAPFESRSAEEARWYVSGGVI